VEFISLINYHKATLFCSVTKLKLQARQFSSYVNSVQDLSSIYNKCICSLQDAVFVVSWPKASKVFHAPCLLVWKFCTSGRDREKGSIDVDGTYWFRQEAGQHSSKTLPSCSDRCAVNSHLLKTPSSCMSWPRQD